MGGDTVQKSVQMGIKMGNFLVQSAVCPQARHQQILQTGTFGYY